MKTLIAYSSTLGCTEQCVSRLKKDLGPDADLVRISRRRKIPLDKYDTIIIGGSIHEGMIQRSVRRFCEIHLKELLKKQVGLFVCCVDPGEDEQALLKSAFPDELLEQSLAKGYFGGELDFKKMNLLHKIMTRKAARLKTEPDIDFDKILAFAKKLQ